MGWVQGVLCSNGAAYLPLLNQTQIDTLQTACNCAIRSVAKLPRKSKDISISDVRQCLNISSVKTLANKAALTQAWKNRESFNSTHTEGPQTRSRSIGNIPHPNQKGFLGKMISTKAKCAYNHLPKLCKTEESEEIAKKIIIKVAQENPII